MKGKEVTRYEDDPQTCRPAGGPVRNQLFGQAQDRCPRDHKSPVERAVEPGDLDVPANAKSRRCGDPKSLSSMAATRISTKRNWRSSSRAFRFTLRARGRDEDGYQTTEPA